MAFIKVDCDDVDTACDDYLSIHEQRQWKENSNDDGAWMEKAHRDMDARSVRNIGKMAKAVKHTNFPYVTLSYDDFVLIGKYL